MKNENDKIISIDIEKTFGKIQNVFMIYSFHKLRIEGIYNMIKAIYKKLTANIIVKVRTLKHFL